MSEHQHEQSDPSKGWFDDKRNIRKIVWALVIVCAGLFAADGFYHKHPYFAAEEFFGFYALYGFVMCVGLVLGAKVIRLFLMRDEDYYDKDDNND